MLSECHSLHDRRPLWRSWLQSYQNRLGKDEHNRARASDQLSTNPKFIPRNYQVGGQGSSERAILTAYDDAQMHAAIQQAEQQDFRELRQLVHVLTNPFEEDPLATYPQSKQHQQGTTEAEWSALGRSTEKYTEPSHLYDWTAERGVCALSCSS